MPQKIGSNVVSWAKDLDAKTAEQAVISASLPFIHGHVALMADAHYGYGATVGSVIPTKGAIIPSAIGVDIGCGMIATRTSLTANDLPDDLRATHSAIAAAVPAGVGKGFSFEGALDGFPEARSRWAGGPLERKARLQYGSLGSGNHFVEVSLDEEDRVWVVLHSGSRGVGNQLATMHIDGAKKLMTKYFIELDDPDLAYLVEGTDEFKHYISDMLWAQDYAFGNRDQMMQATLTAIAQTLGRDVVRLETINCHHNFTTKESHHGTSLWITRKGAIRAREGDRGVIPGSMGTSSYIVHGLGNPSSYNSSSHGAGRRMSRTQARKTLDIQGLVSSMEGIAWNHTINLIDEDPRAYKNIEEVMAAQSDLVAIDHTLNQVLNYKGE